MEYLARFRKWKAFLRQEFPAWYPVKIVFDRKKRLPVDQVGETHRYDDEAGRPERFLIILKEGMPWVECQEALFHEYAHVLRYHLPLDSDNPGDDDKDAVFGILANKIRAKWHE